MSELVQSRQSGNYTLVVVGLIRKDEKVLLGLRPKDSLSHLKKNQKLATGYWEFPGGKIKWGELPKEALKRELKEEININAQINSLKIAHIYAYTPEHAVLLLFYEVISWQGQLKNLYHTHLKWVKPSELHHYNILPANQSILAELVTVLSQPFV